MPMSDRLATTLLGMDLRSPLIVGSGPMTDGEGRIRRAYQSGAGAVACKTIFIEEQSSLLERTAIFEAGMLNTTLYSRRSLDDWLTILRRLRAEGAVIIPNIHASTPAKLGALAARVAEIGFPWLELGIGCPHDGGHERTAPSTIGLYVEAVRREVDVSIAVKFGVGDSLVSQSRAALAAGADAICISDTLPGILVDVRKWQLECLGVAGYSGIGIKPIVLNAIHTLRLAGIRCPIVGIGGIETAEDILQYLYVGAHAVQAYTAFNGSRFEKIQGINRELHDWLAAKNTTIGEIVADRTTARTHPC